MTTPRLVERRRIALMVLAGVVALGACGSAAREPESAPGPIPEASPQVATTTAQSGSAPDAGLVAANWRPSWLDPSGTTLAIAVQVPCGSVWENIESSVTEREHEVAIEAWAVELEQGHCEAADMPHLIELSLDAPLGPRRLVDPQHPEADLTWTIPPGSAQVQVRFRADEGAIDASVPDHTNFVIGRGDELLPMSLAELRDGVDAFAPLLVDLSAPIVGEYRLDDLGDPDHDSMLDGSLEIPPPPTIDPRQVLWLRFQEGAFTMSSNGATLDPSRVSFDWEIIER